jgi:hypothetical protein
VTTEPDLLPAGTVFPMIRDYDSYIYSREWADGAIFVGGFEPNAKPAFPSSRRIPKDWQQQLPEDWEHFCMSFKSTKLVNFSSCYFVCFSTFMGKGYSSFTTPKEIQNAKTYKFA